MKPNLSDIFTSQDKKTLLQLLKALVQAVDNIDYQEPILDENGNEIPKEWFSEMYDKIKVANNEVQVDVSDTGENVYFVPTRDGFKLKDTQYKYSYNLDIFPEDGYMEFYFVDENTGEKTPINTLMPNNKISNSNIENGALRIDEDNSPGYTLISSGGISRFNNGKATNRFQFSATDYLVDYDGYDGQDTYNLSLSYDDDAVNVHKITSGVHNIYSLNKNEFINDKNFIKGSTPNYSYPYSKFLLLSDGLEGENGFIFDFKDGKISFSNPENTNKPQYELDVNPSLKRISIYSPQNGFQYYHPNKVKHNISLKSRVTPNAHEIDVNFSFYTEQSVQSIQGLRDLIDVYSGRNACSGFFMDTDMYLAIDIYKENNTLYVDGRQVMLSGTSIVADEHITYNITESSDVTFTDVVETI